MNVFTKIFDDRLEVDCPGGFPPLVTPANIYDTPKPRNPYLMDALFYLDFVKWANEGTRRMRDTMSEASLPEPEFRQVSFAAAPIVKVILRNDVRHRRVWVDLDAITVVGEALVKELSADEKRAVNFVAQYGEISVSEFMRLTHETWPACKKILTKLVSKGVFDWRQRTIGGQRDPYARYVLRSLVVRPQKGFAPK